MNLRKFQRQEPDVNLTPLIDVVFLLLIFFMVSTSFTRESEIQVNLPQATYEPVETEQKPIDVTIDAKGRFFVNQKLVVNKQLDTLVEAIRRVSEGLDYTSMIITADAMTPHQAVITSMDAARRLGITQLSIATRQRETNNK
ncbi:MAG: ExbD/TolR family protein [Gammaproteobacteria bacterium]